MRYFSNCSFSTSISQLWPWRPRYAYFGFCLLLRGDGYAETTQRNVVKLKIIPYFSNCSFSTHQYHDYDLEDQDMIILDTYYNEVVGEVLVVEVSYQWSSELESEVGTKEKSTKNPAPTSEFNPLKTYRPWCLG